MLDSVSFLVWAAGLLAAISLLLAIGHALAGKTAVAKAYVAVAVLLGLVSAVAASAYAGGYLTP